MVEFLSELIKKCATWFVQWTLQKRRWPFLVVLFVSMLALVFTKERFELPWLDTVRHWFFLSVVAAGFLASAVLYFLFCSPRDRLLGYRWKFSFALVAAALAAGYFGARPFFLESISKDYLIVAISQFKPIGDEATQEAAKFQHRIEQRLNEMAEKGIPIQVFCLDDFAKGDLEERKNWALSAGRPPQRAAHVVVWGDIRKDGGEIFVKPYVTVTTPFRGIPCESPTLRSFITKGPEHVEFKERVSREIGDTVALLCGFGYFRTGDWDAAIRALNPLELFQAHEIKGMAYSLKSYNSSNPRDELLNAEREMRSAIEKGMKEVSEAKGGVPMRPLIGYASVMGELSEMSDPVEAVALNRLALAIYESILTAHISTNQPGLWIRLQSLRAITLSSLADLQEKQESIETLKTATNILCLCLKICVDQNLHQSAPALQHELGSALRRLSDLVNYNEQLRLLELTTNSFTAALHPTDGISVPDLTPWSHLELGSTFGSLARRLDRDNARRMFINATNQIQIAARAFSRERAPRDFVLVNNTLGVVLNDFASALDATDAKVTLYAATNAFWSAMEVCHPDRMRRDWPMLQNNIGVSYLGLGSRSQGEEAIGYFTQATKAFSAAAGAYKDRQRERWAFAMNSLGLAQLNLGQLIGGEIGARHLRASIFSFEAALTVLKEKDFRKETDGIRSSLGMANILLLRWMTSPVIGTGGR